MKIPHLALSSALLLLPLVGCTSSETSTSGNSTSETASSGGKALKLAFVTNNASDFWTVARKGVEKADTELANVSVEFKLPGEGTAAEQTRLVDDLLAKGIDGMAISPVDPANQTELLNKAAGQTLVFTQDSDAAKSKRACYIGTDNVAAGKQAGELLRKALPNGGKVMVFVGKIDAQNAADRYNGVKSALVGSKVQILDVRTDDTDRAKAKSNVSDALVKYPDLAACVGLWSYNGPAILGAVKSAGKVGKVKIVCFDEEDDTLAGIKSGAIEATVVQQPFEFGYQSIINMSKYLGGDKSVIPAGKQIFVPTKAITKANVAAFQTELNKLRGR
ncbi:monosaccharide ABC transporter substrate-binding protein, CUT2 family [Abditibacterium utsteinense]|uniref:Monosaccharide ABC transporter substrate-binding protein, CUT2 family n=1 Tax=Abditibacterium utsteinense TaxID=1960156 RepID=A0A2S8SSC8_9BACT|nr:sugar-binding protein [Abditibacterium utsteinense]PQV63713.1 monosaccharide ABC transporter substrate-binding protein, CUT2 family [Abditibacterium utsteinense]